ncbi:MAG: class I SAM-dependent methyltransferase [Candidatus Omnitrophota bacterium]|nr:class I SAM-dependent methyltransferase [Candidatus Omnitrophota bacterium]MBU1928481.1 class I SAM-dependent methyltransferase [Candidatus Omnitrophota bacterium]
MEAIRIIIEKGISLDKLRIAEVGCGTGTTALSFALMGSSVTLIDFNQKALGLAKAIYQMYGCQPELINADCLQVPEDKLRENFDLVVSSGLMEHFSGNLRIQCLIYHKDLLKTGGFAHISVPNKACPWYQIVRLFRMLTKTWEIDVEVPFSARELNIMSEKAGFKSHYVIHNGEWSGDFKYYARGFVSAVGDILPWPIRNIIKGWKTGLAAKRIDDQGSAEDVRLYLRDRLSQARDLFSIKPIKPGYTNQFNSDLALLAFKS